MLVGRPSDEKSGGALLHADNADTATASGNSARKRVARTLEIFIRNPFLTLFLLTPRVCHAELSACLLAARIVCLSGTVASTFALLLKPPDVAVDHLNARVDLRFYIGERLVVEMRANGLR
jgi:hypothetical protein